MNRIKTHGRCGIDITIRIAVIAVLLLASIAGVASASTATYTWKFNKYAVGQDAAGSAYDSLPPTMPDIIKLPDNSYRMYYGVYLNPAVSGATSAIKSATSTDGISWTVESGYRLFGYGYTGESNIPVNEAVIGGPSVVRLSNGTYRMYYQACSQGAGTPDFRVKSATSSDGITWTREGTRIDINYPSGSATEFSLAGHPNVIRFADNDYAIQLSGNYGANSNTRPSDLVIGTSNDGLTFSNFAVLYTEGHDPYVLKLADGSGYRMFYGNLLERQRTAFSTDGKNWPSQSQTTETILLNSTGGEVTEAGAESPADRTALELSTGEIMLFVNWIGPSSDIALMRQQFSTPVANFTGTPTSGNAPLSVTFTDSSTNTPTSWSWNFGDSSSVNATQQNPVHTYASAGTYTVALTATNSAGSNTLTRTGYITVSSGVVAPVANFAGTPSSGTAPLTVTFTDSSTNTPTSWSWSFGDGSSVNATVKNPVHTYASAGTYTVALTATNSAGSNTITRTNYITVTSGSTATYTWKFSKYAVGQDATGSARESSFLSMSDIIKLPDNSYRMYYGVFLSPAVQGATSAIKSATSTDGISWTVESGYRLFGYGYTGESNIPANEGSINGPRVVRLSNGTYRMYYQASTPDMLPSDFRVKSAISSDGLTWTREGTRVNITVPVAGPGQLSLAGHSAVIRFADNDYVILFGGNYETPSAHNGDLVIGTSNDGMTFSHFSVLYTDGHDPNVLKLADGSGYRLFYGNLMDRQRTAFSSDGKNWPSQSQTTETVFINSTGYEVTESSTEAPGDRSALELASGEIMLFVNWGNPSKDIALMRQQFSTPVANFAGTPTSGTAPLTVTFTDSSTNTPTSWSWNFGDNSSVNATVKNPVHTYANSGTYTVALTATNSAGSNVCTKTSYITVSSGGVAPVANFTGTPASGTAPLPVQFTDTSTNTPTSWNWSFGDGISSTEKNPSHIYIGAGAFTISLTATNSAGSNTMTRTNYITVSSGGVAPVANFIGTPTSGTAPLTVQFTDSSTNTPTSWFWLFGDTTSSTSQNPSHMYTGTSNYTVSLTARNAAGSNITIRTNYITITPSSTPTYTWKINKYAVGKNATGSAYESFGPSQSDIIKLPDNTYRMYYGVLLIPSVSGADTAIRSATSIDGISWTVEPGYRLFGYGYTGESNIPENEFTINGPSVVRLSNGTYRMYYHTNSQNVSLLDLRIKSAISPDGINWTREGTRIDINYPNFSATEFSFADHCNVIRFADNDYAIQISGNYGTGRQPTDIVIGTSNDGLTFSHFSVLYTYGHDPYVLKLADGSGYRMFYGNLLERQRTAFSTDGKNWPSQSQTTETILLNSTGSEVTEASTEGPGDRTAMELPSGEIMLFVNWGMPSMNIALMRQQFSSPVANFTGTPTSGTAPLTVTFTDSSTNTPTAWSWNFGDSSSVNATVKNPVHTYASTGTYTVALTTTNVAGSNTKTIDNYITVSAASGVDNVGVYRGGVFYRNGADAIVYGLSTDTPVVGDWNGDHISEVGVFRGGVFYRNGADAIVYGLSTDTPVVGDWNGDGISEVGVFRGGVFYRNGADAIVYGLSTDTPVIGDWNGDGISEVGVYRGGVFYRNGADAIVYGLSTDTPVIGDWNGDGMSEVGVYRGGVFYRNGADAIVYGLSTDTPVIGKWT